MIRAPPLGSLGLPSAAGALEIAVSFLDGDVAAFGQLEPHVPQRILAHVVSLDNQRVRDAAVDAPAAAIASVPSGVGAPAIVGARACARARDSVVRSVVA
ncbi:hypothetical protein PMKS-000555 [Pichia membranifaciens]|uniref:Uncharacterized protein n=1 Tax=Pichia membranifaciens TaxID=4926 RepID=A0A1Q2YC32_9ASCO|nr:hypothetical protein PMKS-000555 [Pichia membranifaciens]